VLPKRNRRISLHFVQIAGSGYVPGRLTSRGMMGRSMYASDRLRRTQKSIEVLMRSAVVYV